MKLITIRGGNTLVPVIQDTELSIVDSRIEVIVINCSATIRIEGTSRVFTSFIGETQPIVQVQGTSPLVWETVRCGSKVHHDGICDAVCPTNSSHLFCRFYELPVKNGFCELFKRVDEEYHDYFSRRLTYSPGTTVVAEDWSPNERIVCGNALHLCATREQSDQWNEGGKLLMCRVALKDMCVFPYNVQQVRCRKVYVIGSAATREGKP